MLSVKLIGAQKLIQALSSKDTVLDPLMNGIKKITLKLERFVKQSTVVDTGRLRSSIAHQFGQDYGQVGTNVVYASFVEYGTQKMAARHMEGSTKVLGQGMFSYGVEKLEDALTDEEKAIAKDIEVEFD